MERLGITTPRDRNQPDGAHGSRAQDRRVRTDDQNEQNESRATRGDPRHQGETETQECDASEHDRHVAARNGKEMREPGPAESLECRLVQDRRVADRKTPRQTRCPRLHVERRVAEPFSYGGGHRMRARWRCGDLHLIWIEGRPGPRAHACRIETVVT
jgi:hypothetical protein